MKKFLMALFMGAMLLVSSFAFADFTVPTPTGYVTDTSGKLSPSQMRALNQRLTDYQRTTGNEIGVLVVPSLEGGNLEDVTHKVFQTYGVGKKGLDNGILLFVAVNDHKMRLQTGKGVEGEITDIQANDILNTMKPHFRHNGFYAGINTALDGIAGKLDNRFAQKADPGGQGQQFNKPIAPPVQETTASTSTKSNGCDVSDAGVGNVAGWSFGLLALFVAGIAFARRYIRNREEKAMREVEALVDEQIAAEAADKKAAADRAVATEQRARDEAVLKANREAAAALAANTKAVISTPPPNLPVRTYGAFAPTPLKVSPPQPALKPVAVAPVPVRVDEPPVRLPKHDIAAEIHAQEEARAAEVRLAEARRAREAAERLEEQRAEARRERVAEENRRRQREDEEAAAAALAATVLIGSSWSSSNDDSSSSDSSSSWSGGSSSSDDNDSGFGGGDSGGGGASSDWDSGSSDSGSSSDDSGSSSDW